MALTAAGRFDEALDKIKEDNPLPGICGRVCHHPCESACRRSELDQPVAICDVKRFLSDYRSAVGGAPPGRAKRFLRNAASQRTGRDHRFGAGRAHGRSLLAKAGFRCTVLEAMPEPGGMLRWAFLPTGCPATCSTGRYATSSPWESS